jgi:hypothetical protein
MRAASVNTGRMMKARSNPPSPTAILRALVLGAALCAAAGCHPRDGEVAAPAGAAVTAEQAEARRLAKQRRLEQRAAEAQASAAAPRSAIVMIALAWLGKLSGH